MSDGRRDRFRLDPGGPQFEATPAPKGAGRLFRLLPAPGAWITMAELRALWALPAREGGQR